MANAIAAKTGRKPLTKAELEKKRIARNEYSKKWKKAHAKKVREWNSAWYDAKKKAAKKKASAKKSPAKKAAPKKQAPAPQTEQPKAA